uniref:Uncharacterized protein n=1 Tax=Oryza rufipogon TaxID=4529 RepID=A0A0E0QHW5_ORYRU
MSSSKGLSSSVPPQGGSGASKRHADIHHEVTNLPGSKGFLTPSRNNNQQPYNGQGAGSLTYGFKTFATKVSQLGVLIHTNSMTISLFVFVKDLLWCKHQHVN